MIQFHLHKQLQFAGTQGPLDVKVELEPGSFVTLYGKSGAGKTSVLRMLAGLIRPEKGRIEVNGQVWYDEAQSLHLSPQARKVGFVFQDYALFPNMTVRQNLEFALAKGQSKSVVEQLIEVVELGDLQKRKPGALSGGQQQRIALARAIVQKPQLLLLDEPLSALDREMRAKLQTYLLTIHREFNLTTLLVSHDVSEILKLSDQVVEIDRGKVVRKGAPQDLFTRKEMSGKFQFVGEVMAREQQDFIYILSVLIGQDLVKVVVDESEAATLEVGDQVLVASKAFNPVVRKIEG